MCEGGERVRVLESVCERVTVQIMCVRMEHFRVN